MKTATAHTDLRDPAAAGRALAEQIAAALPEQPHALLLFASPTYDHAPMLRALADAFPDALLVGSSSAGEFTHASSGEETACLLALRSDEVRFAAGVGRALQASPSRAAADILSSFKGQREAALHRAALVMTDALAGCGPELIENLVIATKAQYQFFGGGAGDNGHFVRTVVFHGTELLSDAAVALEIISPRPLGVGVGHG